MNNFVIDYAKTLYKPEFPEHIDNLIKAYTKAKVPHFFIYAKNKKSYQVEGSNNSIVNQLELIFQNSRLNFPKKTFGKLDYTLMMKNPDIVLNYDLIDKYLELSKTYHYSVNMENNKNSNLSYIAELIKMQLDFYKHSREEITDILVKYLYKEKNSRSKAVLWFCYGDIILENLKNNVGDKTSVCEKCGKRYSKTSNNQKYCDDCKRYQPIKTKKIICIDCGKEVIIDSKKRNKKRCDECQHEENKRIKREYWNNKN